MVPAPLLGLTGSLTHSLPRCLKPRLSFPAPVKLKYVKLGYQYLVNHILTLLLIPIMVGVLIEVLRLGPDEILNLWNSLHFDLVQILCSSFLIIFATHCLLHVQPRSIYLVDYACYKPPVMLRVPFATFMEHARLVLSSQPKSVEFQTRILERSGLGEETCLPLTVSSHPTPSLSAMVINKYKMRSNIRASISLGWGAVQG
ncbi:3-ketoacyl-CoA synthase 6 [Vitis vinifera]|uniref:3-ketoacyl-CoA synthase 6 n=1 Tax=Vitis vinifera TaxID=29760 RepID=A0A438ECH9_VITVI|nr:3-ketoacyl-CoA synthase 6 [Vitis vinifera]